MSKKMIAIDAKFRDRVVPPKNRPAFFFDRDLKKAAEKVRIAIEKEENALEDSKQAHSARY